jgi:hypothetical protein
MVRKEAGLVKEGKGRRRRREREVEESQSSKALKLSNLIQSHLISSNIV